MLQGRPDRPRAERRRLVREEKMSRFHHPHHRDTLDHSKYIKLLAFFWVYLLTMYLLSLWT